MSKQISAFKIKIKGKILDYRLGENLILEDVKDFFGKRYKVQKIWVGGRHILGILEKGGKEFFLKLSTTEGISAVTRIEYNWNDKFNKQIKRSTSNFWIPINYDSGYYKNNLFYLITDRLKGTFIAKKPAKEKISNVFLTNIPKIIKFSEIIQELKGTHANNKDSHIWFLNKTKSWFQSTPAYVQNEYRLEELLQIVNTGISNLQMKPRHGDFTPWHLIQLKTGQLALIDGEHAMFNSVELYDIGYFVQRVFSVLQNSELAERILNMLKEKKYEIEKLKVILAARAIGGFLDESLVSLPNYYYANKFKRWTISLKNT